MGAPSLDSCERDLVARVQRHPGDPDAHEALAAWFRRTERPVLLEPRFLQDLTRRWLAGETTPGLTDLLLADQGLASWPWAFEPPAFWIEADRATRRHGRWVDQDTGLPLRLRRLADDAAVVLIPSGPKGPFFVATRPFSFADLLRVGGAVSAGVRADDLEDEDQPAFRITARAQARLLEWCRGQAPTTREWWVAVVGIDPGELSAGAPPAPEHPAGRAIHRLTDGQGAVEVLERTSLGLEDVTLPILAQGHGELVTDLRDALAARPRRERVPGDRRLQMRLRSIHRVPGILREMHDLPEGSGPRVRRGAPFRIDIRGPRRSFGSWLRDLVTPAPAPPPWRDDADGRPVRDRVREWSPTPTEPEPELPDRSDPEVLAATTAAACEARATTGLDRAPEALLVRLLRPLVEARRGKKAAATLPDLGLGPRVPEDPLVGTATILVALSPAPGEPPPGLEELAAQGLLLAELRQPLAFCGITEVLLDVAGNLAAQRAPELTARARLLTARQAVLRGLPETAQATLAGAPPADPEDAFRWAMTRARAHRDDPALAGSLLPPAATGAHRAGELTFLRATLALAGERAPEALDLLPELLFADLDRAPPSAGLPAMTLALLALARLALEDLPGAWEAARQARDLARPWVARRRRSTELNLLTRLDGPPSRDPEVLRSLLRCLITAITLPASLRDLPGYLLLEGTRRAADLRQVAGLPPPPAPLARYASSRRLHVLEDAWWAWVTRLRDHAPGRELLDRLLSERLPPAPGSGLDLDPAHPSVTGFPYPRVQELLDHIAWRYRQRDEGPWPAVL